ncbi:hypothetical protein EJ08DRAFT_736954 [Tothia fuscella]|uniref:FAD-binding domain-containing protein n=1 Tax=Tothia fuscella TaxID=1048955 RepID=A0A9P4NJP9_9PEZI|nr:hypothetical protein EJ08DRAFT_736954 [Tothia fuscella]
MSQKSILISGAGLASLLLAQSLKRASISFLIFERDASISFRAQGYRIRLSSEALDGIESVLTPDHFKKFWDTCGKTGGSGFVAIDAITGEIVVQSPNSKGSVRLGGPSGPVESLSSRDGKIVGIARGDMRKSFLEGYGVRAVFEDGSKSVEGDIGKLKTYDTGARGIHDQAPASAFKELREGVWRIVDDSDPKGRLFVITNVRPEADPDVQLGWTVGAAPGVILAPNDDYTITGHTAADVAKRFTAGWAARLKSLFDEMDVENAAFCTCSTPSGVPDWDNDPRVTVIGDAVHSMTPAGGISANTACRDSALLGRLMADAGGFAEGVTAAYEEIMRVYGSEAVASSYGMATAQFGIVIDENSPTVEVGATNKIKESTTFRGRGGEQTLLGLNFIVRRLATANDVGEIPTGCDRQNRSVSLPVLARLN